MRKRLGLIIVFFIMLTSNIYAYNDTSSNRTIILAGDNNLPPFEYVDDKGIYKGFNIDIMRAISLEMGIEIELVPLDWFEALEALDNGSVNAIQGMKYSSKRDAYYDFSTPYVQTSHSIFVNAENKYIHELGDLSNKRVAIQKNDISKYLLVSMDIKNIIEVNNQEAALMMLTRGEIDAYVGNKLTGIYYIQKKGYESVVKTVGIDLMVENYCIATLDGNEEAIQLFNEGIKRINESGAYEKIYKKWFGETFYNNPLKLKRYLIAMMTAFSVAIVIVIMIVKWNRQLKKKVDERTDELRRENILKEKILDSIFSAIVVIDNNKEILHSNDNANKMMQGHSDKGTIDKTFISSIIDEEDVLHVLRDGKEIMSREVVCESNNFSTYQYNMSPILMDNNSIGAVISIRDVTEEKVLRESLVAKDKLKTLGRLAATVAHEIKNPLTAIKAYVELLPHKYESQKFRSKLLEDVPKEIDRLDNYINDLLNFSHPKKGKKEILDVGDVIQSTISLLSREAQKRNIALEHEIVEDSRIYGCRNHVKQILMNLLINAIDAVRDRENSRIRVLVTRDESLVNIHIIDNGIGLKEDIINRIFEPHYTTKTDGIGLGLAITQQLVKENKGEISVTSKPGIGTVFKIVFERHNE